jgi:phage gp46-like protein
MDLALAFLNEDLDIDTTEEGLRTSVLLSLYVDQRAEEDELEDGKDNRGWWGDMFEDMPMGSKLWLLERQKITRDVLNRCAEYSRDCLEWMMKDGIVDTVSVNVVLSGQNITTEIELKRDEESFKFKFDDLWKIEEQRNGI